MNRRQGIVSGIFRPLILVLLPLTGPTNLGRTLLRCLVLLVTLLLPARLAGQEAGAAATAGQDTILGIQILRADIFDQEELARKWYARIANGLHVMTKESVIRRELLFQEGQPFDSALVLETKRNLRRLGIFREVRIDSVPTDSGLLMRVWTRDSWTTSADMNLSSGGGDIAFRVRLLEENLFGSAAQARIEYRTNPDRSALGLGYLRRYLFGSNHLLRLDVDLLSDGTVVSGGVGLPFRSQRDRFAWFASSVVGDFGVLRFRGGDPEPAVSLKRRLALGQLEGTWAVVAGRKYALRLGLFGQIKRDDFRPDSLPQPTSKTVQGTGGPVLHWLRPRLVVTRNLVGFGREEDFDLGSSVRAGVLAAPGAFGYQSDGLGAFLSFRQGAVLPGGIIRLAASAGGLMNSAGLDSGTAVVGATARLSPARGHLITLHADAGWQRDPTPGLEFDLGLSFGMRGFRSHAFTGDRRVYASGEYRISLFNNVLDVFALGVAAFADYGGAWFAGDRERYGRDAGLGLRLGLNRVSATEPIRIDLAYAWPTDIDPAGWTLSVGKGVPFDLLPFGN